jgi:hypothetical protein
MQSTPEEVIENVPEEILAAQREVQQRRSELADSLRVASESSTQLVKRVGEQAKPLLIGVAAVASVVAIAAIVVASRRRRPLVWIGPPPAQRPSAFTTAARTAGIWMLRYAARRALQRAADRTIARPTAR